MHIAYFISSHGYGHGVRACAIANRLSPGISLTILTKLPELFFQEEMHRPFVYREGEFDCGCCQTDGITVDVDRTLETYMTMADRNRGLLDSEIAWCTREHITGIVSDIAPFAFAIAAAAGIPSVAITNFTWEDIYAPYLYRKPAFKACYDEMCRQYALANLALALTPASPMRCFKKRLVMPVIARSGARQTGRIRKRYHIAPHKKIGLIYTGNYGMDEVDWGQLEKFTQWEFVGAYPLPQQPENFHIVSKNDFPYTDVSASVDLIVGKAGYGILSECLSNGIPLLYMPREDFAEYPVLDAAIREWGHGFCLSKKDFYELQWNQVLETVEHSSGPEKMNLTGAQDCAATLMHFFTNPGFE